MKTKRPAVKTNSFPRKRRGGLASEPPASIADPRAIGRAGIKAASAIPGSREPGKRRGGQPKNQNALKHGFYSALFKDRERTLLEQMQPADLSAEIELIRVTSARFLESLASSRDPGDFEANLTALRLVNLSAQSIAMLLRVQTLSGSLRKDMDEALIALEEVAEKLNIAEDPNAATHESGALDPTN